MVLLAVLAFGGRTFMAKKHAEWALLRFADRLSKVRVELNEVDAATARHQLDLARTDLGEARSSRSAWGVRLASNLPVGSRIARSYDAFLVVSEDLYQSADHATTAAELVNGSRGGPKLMANRHIDFNVLDEVRANATAGLAALDRARLSLDAVEPVPIFRGIGRAKVVVADQIARGQKDTAVVSEVLDKLPALLGKDGPRTYLFGMQNTAELRGSGGGLLNVALITINEQGDVKFENKGSIYFLENEDVTKRVYQSWAWPADDFWTESITDTHRLGNTNWSPHFPTVGYNVTELYRIQSGGGKLDGVFAATPEFFARVLQATGPVAVEGEAQPIDASSLIPFILHDAYVRYGPDQASRRRINAQLVTDVADRALSAPDVAPLLKELGRSLPDHALQAYMVRPDEERLMKLAGMDGAVPDTTGDFGMWLRNNAAGNKVDYFTQHRIVQDVTLDADGTSHDVVTNTLINPAPPNPGPPGTRVLEYLDHYSESFMAVYIPGAATFEGDELRMGQIPSPLPLVNREAGKLAIAKGGRVLPQSQGDYVVRYSLRGAAGRAADGTWAYTLTRARPARLGADDFSLRVRLPQGAVPVNPAGWTHEADGTWRVDAQVTGTTSFTLLYRLA